MLFPRQLSAVENRPGRLDCQIHDCRAASLTPASTVLDHASTRGVQLQLERLRVMRRGTTVRELPQGLLTTYCQLATSLKVHH
jgi:hypothetical protein